MRRLTSQCRVPTVESSVVKLYHPWCLHPRLKRFRETQDLEENDARGGDSMGLVSVEMDSVSWAVGTLLG